MPLTEFDEIADLIASDIGPVVNLTREEAKMIAHGHLCGESPACIDAVATTLYRHYSQENWT